MKDADATNSDSCLRLCKADAVATHVAVYAIHAAVHATHAAANATRDAVLVTHFSATATHVAVYAIHAAVHVTHFSATATHVAANSTPLYLTNRNSFAKYLIVYGRKQLPLNFDVK